VGDTSVAFYQKTKKKMKENDNLISGKKIGCNKATSSHKKSTQGAGISPIM
jgi:hypothetical protein